MAAEAPSSNLSADCNQNATDVVALIAMGAVGGTATIVCIPVVVLVIALKLYRQLVYRLTLYLVMSALMFGLVCVLHLAQLPFIERGNHSFNNNLCIAAAFLSSYTLWVKSLFMLCVAIHLFAYSVCFKNLKKLEAAYVILSLTAPGVVSAIPFITRSYGPAGEWCWIVNSKDSCYLTVALDRTGYTEELALWFIPTSLLLVFSNGLMIAMVIVLQRRVCLGETPILKEQYKKALKHMLPTVVYPISYFVLFLPTIARRDEHSRSQKVTYALIVADGVCTAGYGLVAALTLLWHIVMVIWLKRRRAAPLQMKIVEGKVYGAVAVNPEFITPSEASINCTEETDGCPTDFAAPYESEVDS